MGRWVDLGVLETLGNILITSVAFIFTAVILGQILLPIIYGIPRAINLVIKGHAKIRCIPIYLISVFLGLALLYLITEHAHNLNTYKDQVDKLILYYFNVDFIFICVIIPSNYSYLSTSCKPVGNVNIWDN